MRPTSEARRPDPERGVLADFRTVAREGGGRPGLHPLGLGGRRDGLLLAPEAAEGGQKLPLLVMLHGAGASATDVLPMVEEPARERGVLALLPESRGQTWDMIRRAFDGDVVFLGKALSTVAARYAVDPARVAIAGFSDGASFALSLGLVNGALFSDLIAFSPGFMAPTRDEDDPRIFIRHGRDDPVLPVERCSRRLVRELAALGHDLDYAEFTGGHVVRMDDVRAAFDRFLGGPPAPG